MSGWQDLLASPIYDAIGISAFVVVLAGWREARRRRRRDADAVGWVDWTTVQMLALIALAALGLLAWKG